MSRYAISSKCVMSVPESRVRAFPSSVESPITDFQRQALSLVAGLSTLRYSPCSNLSLVSLNGEFWLFFMSWSGVLSLICQLLITSNDIWRLLEYYSQLTM